MAFLSNHTVVIIFLYGKIVLKGSEPHSKDYTVVVMNILLTHIKGISKVTLGCSNSTIMRSFWPIYVIGIMWRRIQLGWAVVWEYIGMKYHSEVCFTSCSTRNAVAMHYYCNDTCTRMALVLPFAVQFLFHIFCRNYVLWARVMHMTAIATGSCCHTVGNVQTD